MNKYKNRKDRVHLYLIKDNLVKYKGIDKWIILILRKNKEIRI
jgi:hypothetical protein